MSTGLYFVIILCVYAIISFLLHLFIHRQRFAVCSAAIIAVIGLPAYLTNAFPEISQEAIIIIMAALTPFITVIELAVAFGFMIKRDE